MIAIVVLVSSPPVRLGFLQSGLGQIRVGSKLERLCVTALGCGVILYVRLKLALIDQRKKLIQPGFAGLDFFDARVGIQSVFRQVLAI